MPNILTLDTMKDLSIDEIVNLYRQGYVIEDLVDPVVNFGKVTVSTGYSNLATSIILNTGDGARLPDPVTDGQFNLVWYNSSDYTDPSDDPNVEIVRVTAKSVDTLTITRAQEGTLASNKNTVGKTYRMILSPTKKTITDIDTQKVSKSGDTMTGVLNLPTNGLVVGTNQLVTSGGNVGIGATTGINSPLYVKGLSTVGPLGIQLTDQVTTTIFMALSTPVFAQVPYIAGNTVLAFGANGNERMRIDTLGNVGIGTTTPAQKLHISGSSSETVIRIANTGISGRNWGIFSTNGTSMLGTGNLILFDESIGGVPGARMVIDPSGNVGIGTTTPSSLLDIKGQTSIGARTDAAISLGGLNIRQSTAAEFLAWTDGAVQGVLGGVGGVPYIGSKNNTAFSIYTNNTERVRIDNLGKVGIGTTPLVNLEITGNIGISYEGNTNKNRYIGIMGHVSPYLGGTTPWAGMEMEAAADLVAGSHDAWLHFITSDSGVIGGARRMTIDKSGNVGIGTTTLSYQLQLSTDSAAKPGTNTWTISSDERIKKDIRPFTDGISTIININPVWYKYNGKGGFKDDNIDHVGIIGQRIQDIAPYTINTYRAKLNEDDEEETELLNFNSHALTFVLINSIKELKKEIDSLKDEIRILKTVHN